MTIQAKPVTAEELLAMPDDGFRYELSSGELKKSWRHQERSMASLPWI